MSIRLAVSAVLAVALCGMCAVRSGRSRRPFDQAQYQKDVSDVARRAAADGARGDQGSRHLAVAGRRDAVWRPTRRCRSCFPSRRPRVEPASFGVLARRSRSLPRGASCSRSATAGPVKTSTVVEGQLAFGSRAHVRDSDERWPAVRERLGRGAPVAEDPAVGADVSGGHAVAGRRSLRRVRRAEDDAGCRCPRRIGRVPGRRASDVQNRRSRAAPRRVGVSRE